MLLGRGLVQLAAATAGRSRLSTARRVAGPATALAPFHLAFPVNDLDKARAFYGAVLGCQEGRSSNKWIDYSLFAQTECLLKCA